MTELMRRNLGGAWPLDALRLGAVMAASAFALGAAVDATLAPAQDGAGLVGEHDAALYVVAALVYALALAPLVETLPLAMLHWLLRARLGLSLPAWACASAALFALAHLGTNRVPLPQLAAFLLMSYQYALVRDRHGAGTAFAAVALSHATYNFAVFAVGALWLLGRG